MLQTNAHNLLLAQLSPEDFDCIAAHLEPMELPKDFTIAHYNRPISHYYFLEAGIGSMVAVSSSGAKAEVGLVGRDGVTPLAVILDRDTMPFECMMQVAGHGNRIQANALVEIIESRPSINRLLLRFVQTLLAQTAYTALSNAVHKIDTRLARWILMCHDRVGGDEFFLTHEFMAMMLGVRRQSVTEALHVLEGEQLILSARGLVTVRNRALLEQYAGDAYGMPEKEYQLAINGFR